jgi:hypothetical protein
LTAEKEKINAAARTARGKANDFLLFLMSLTTRIAYLLMTAGLSSIKS